MTTLFHRSLTDVIERVRATTLGPLLVVPVTPYIESLSDEILGRFPGVALLFDDSDERRVPRRPGVGRRHGHYLSVWDFPEGAYRNVLFVGPPESLGLRALLIALRAGVRRILFLSPATDLVVQTSIGSQIVLASLRIAQTGLQRLGRGMGSRVDRVAALKPAVESYRRARTRRRKTKFEDQLNRLFSVADRMRDDKREKSDRVALAIGTIGPGGSERQVVNTALALASSGQYHPVVMCSDLSSNTSAFYRPLLEGAGVELVDLRAPEVPHVNDVDQRLIEMSRAALSQAAFDISGDVVRLLTAMRVTKPAVVHAFLDDTNIKAGIAAVLAGVPRVVLSFRSVAPNNFALHTPFMRPAYNALRRRSEVHFSANSEIGAEDYRRWLGTNNLPITVIRNGIDFTNFVQRADDLKAVERAKYGIPPDVKVLGTIMRMSEEKQPLRWAEAALDISRRLPDVHFVMVGDGPLRSEVIEFLNNGRIGRRIHLLGYVRDIPSVLKCMDVFLLTSRLEGLPNVLIEAQAMGVPVVTTPAGGAVEALQNGVTGLVCRDWTSATISEACIRVLADPVFCDSLSKAGTDYVRKTFAINRMLRETLAIYED